MSALSDADRLVAQRIAALAWQECVERDIADPPDDDVILEVLTAHFLSALQQAQPRPEIETRASQVSILRCEAKKNRRIADSYADTSPETAAAHYAMADAFMGNYILDSLDD